MSEPHKFTEISKDRLKEALGHDVVPSLTSEIFNSLVVWRQIDSPYLSPLTSIKRTEYMVRITQENKGESIYRGRNSNLLPNDLIEDAGYFQITSGYRFDRALTVEIGVSRKGIIACPEAIGVLVPSPLFPQQEGVKRHPILSINIQDYSDTKAMPFFVHLDEGLGLNKIANAEQEALVLEETAKFIADVKTGKPIDVPAFRARLIENCGILENDEGLSQELSAPIETITPPSFPKLRRAPVQERKNG